jgi:hypothetical protein
MVDFASNYGGQANGNLPSTFRNPYGRGWNAPVLIFETWGSYVDGFVPDVAPLWNCTSGAGTGPHILSASNLIQHGLSAAGNDTVCVRTTSPGIRYEYFHSIFTDFISIPRDTCITYLNLESTDNSVAPGQIRAKFQRSGNDVIVSGFGPTVGAFGLGTIVNGATGINNVSLNVYPLVGSSRLVRVYANGAQIGSDQLVGVGSQLSTNRNCGVYFGADANVDNAARCGKLTIRGIA